jgi:septum formation protein
MDHPLKHLTGIILASASPRRHELLSGLGLPFRIVKSDTEESFPPDIPVLDVAPFLAKKKADAFEGLKKGDFLITCDTTVCTNNMVINKPADYVDAKRMLKTLSGKEHTVVTGVCLRTIDRELLFSEKTIVKFAPLTESEIEYYLERFKPYDKAGAYGIQEWIGYVAIERIEGCYYNVMGLPVARLYKELVGWSL